MPAHIQTRQVKKDLQDFKKLHSKTFLYFLQEYEKYQELKNQSENTNPE